MDRRGDKMLFVDRHDAGRQLASIMAEYRGTSAIVLALPRGGVVVGYEIAIGLDLPLDVLVTRKIGPPGNPEYALGAVAENGEVVVNEAEIRAYGIPHSYIEGEIRLQQEEIQRRKQLYRDGRDLPSLVGRTAIVVDDGVATGFTTAAALRAVRQEQPSAVVLAVPIGPAETIDMLARLADRVICLATPEPFYAVGRFYDHFEQVTDEEVRQYLDASRRHERAIGQE